MTVRSFGYKPDPHDPRDLPFAARRVAASPVPETSDVDIWNVLAKDQLGTSSCVGNAVAGGVRRAFAFAGVDCPELSARATYRTCLNLDGSSEDGGTFLRSGVRAVQKLGACSERVFPFSEDGILNPLSVDAIQDAADRGGLRGYYRIASGDVDGVARALGAGFPVVAGWDVSQAFASGDGRGVIEAQTGPIAGGHALCLVGHGPSEMFEPLMPQFRPNGKHWSRLYRVLNSWGPFWGYDGRFLATPEFVAQARDVWALDVRGEP